jgi:hypothetical protein
MSYRGRDYQRFTASGRRIGSQELLAVSQSLRFTLRARPAEVLVRPNGPSHSGTRNRTVPVESLLSIDAVAPFERSSEKRERQSQTDPVRLSRVSADMHLPIVRGDSHRTV